MGPWSVFGQSGGWFNPNSCGWRGGAGWGGVPPPGASAPLGLRAAHLFTRQVQSEEGKRFAQRSSLSAGPRVWTQYFFPPASVALPVTLKSWRRCMMKAEPRLPPATRPLTWAQEGEPGTSSSLCTFPPWYRLQGTPSPFPSSVCKLVPGHPSSLANALALSEPRLGTVHPREGQGLLSAAGPDSPPPPCSATVLTNSSLPGASPSLFICLSVPRA